MSKNTIAAVALSVVFLILWMRFYVAPRQGELSRQAAESAVAAGNAGARRLTTSAAGTGGGHAGKTVAGKDGGKGIAAAMPSGRGNGGEGAEEKFLIFENEKVRATFSSAGGAIKKYVIKEDGGAADIVAAGGSFFETDGAAALTRAGNTVTSVQILDGGARLKKNYRFSAEGLEFFGMVLEGGKPADGVVVMKFSGGLAADGADDKENASLNAVRYLAGKSQTRVKSGRVPLAGAKWLSSDNRYFILALTPEGGFGEDYLDVTPKTKMSPAVANLSLSVAGGRARGFAVAAGGKSFARLKKYGVGLEQTVDFGFLGALGKFFLGALVAINSFTKNYGWAIVILSLGIQLVTLPLSLKSLKATADMKRLQPLMREIQTKFKDDPKRMNVEVMNLYRTHRVNPLSGCLPMLLQMPIFWALFTTLRNAYELRHAPWIFWIKDLSAHDPFYVLPVLMGAGMFAQQFMSGATSDPQNKMMGYVFPAVFTFMFLKFPSGVVLYWLINSVLTIMIQLFFLEKEIIREHHEAVVVKK